MLGILYCLASFLLGTSIALYFPTFSRIEEKFTLGIILGFTLTTWFTFLLSLITGSLKTEIILSVTLISAFFSIILLKHIQKKNIFFFIKPSKKYIFTLIIFSLLLSWVNFNSIKFDSQGNLRAMQTAWGDYAMHLSYLIHFSEKNPLTLNHPLLTNQNLLYPFLMNFLSAILYKSGFNYVDSIVVTNIVFSIALISIILIFSQEFTKKEIAGLFGITLLFLNGNFGFIFALGKELKEIIQPTSFYTKIDTVGLYWGNSLSVLFLSQRTFLWGMCTAIFIYLILYRELFSEKESISPSNLLLAGVLLGLLPLIHTPSFLTLCFVSFIFFIIKMRKEWLYFILTAGIFSLPQIIYLTTGPNLIRKFWIQPGWSFKTSNPLLLIVYWLYNLGIISLFIIWGLFFLEKNKKLFYLPFLLIFILANFIMIHPWDWDNAKYFLHWFFLSCVLASLALTKILDYTRFKKPDRIILIIIIIFFSIFSGLLDYIYLNRVSFVMANKKEQEIAKWIRENISSTALILTSDTHNHPVSMLSGRNIVLGYRGWLWSHGYNYSKIEKDVPKIYQTADLKLSKKYKITHIVISPYEKELKPNLRLFLNSNKFKEIYRTNLDSGVFRIFEVVY